MSLSQMELASCFLVCERGASFLWVTVKKKGNFPIVVKGTGKWFAMNEESVCSLGL